MSAGNPGQKIYVYAVFFFSALIVRAATLQKCGSEHFLRFSLPKVS